MDVPAQRGLQESRLTALEAVLGCPVPHHDTADGLTPLVEALRTGIGADAVAVVSRAVVPECALLAATGLDDAAADHVRAGVRAIVDAGLAGTAPDLGDLPVSAVAPLPGTRGEAALLVVSAAGHGAEGVARAAVDVAAERAGAALEVGRLRHDLDRAMAQILESDERLLGRIGLDIHDGPTQHLSVALLEIQLLETDLADAEENGQALPPALRPALERVYETLGGALTEMRELIGHLRPAQFEDRRLADILQDAITGFENRSGASVEAEMIGEFPVNGVSVTQRITFYRILQEALNNAHRHGRARAVRVRVVEAQEGITLEVADDGRGFDAEGALRPRTGAPIARFGLHGMRDRASVLGGSFAVASAPGQGTTVRVFLPRWRPDEDVARVL
jgi:signal transduction histidine kinase